MVRTIALTAALTLFAGTALADPILGNWRTKSGETAAIAKCGGSFCIQLKTGDHAGKRIGTFKAEGGGAYSGRITDPGEDKTYRGKANINGSSLIMKGCVLGGLICRGETWSKL